MPGYVMNEELKRTVQQVCLQFLNSFQPRPKRGRRPRRSGSSGTSEAVKTAIVQATAVIPGSIGGSPREPITSTDFTTIKGDTFDEIENWSLVDISNGSYMVILEVDGDGVIVSAFC